MRIHPGGLAAILILGAGLSGCAAASMGTVAGNVAGGAGWVAMKTGSLAWKGGTIAAKATGKTVVGAARGVHEEFSPKDQAGGVDAGAGQGADDALGNRAKDVGPVASAQGQGAAFAD
ncbi:MAG TPA: hypothetical protein VIJ94_17380 [Caulobacteraceae bacterium]